MEDTFIPFNKPAFVPEELSFTQQALESGHLSGDGAFTKQCNTWLEQRTGAAKVLITTSCTHALELSALLLNLQAGDEVIIHLRIDGECVRAARGEAGVRGYPPGYT
jgi:dTDP-4-amino-4,6-dideoxygalactose transaminase